MFLTVSTFLFFTALVALISYLATRRHRMDSSDAYFLGGRSLTAWIIAGSLMLTNLSTEHLIGLNGDAFNHTFAVTAWETTAAIAMVVMALFFLPRYLKSGFATIPQFLAERYDGQTRTIATLIFLFSYVVAILPVVLLFGATGIDSLFDISEQTGLSPDLVKWMLVWGIGALGSIYAVFGGLRAVAISDTVNGIGFLIAALLIPALALWMIGDGNPMAGLETVYTAEKPKFDVTGDEPGSFLPFSVLFTGMIVNQIFFWCTNQSIVQRALGAKNLKEGQKGVLIAAGFKLLGPAVVVLPGIIAFYLFKDDLSKDQYLQAYPMLVKAVLPDWLVGFFAAVMVGAVLSTFNSVLNSSATLFSEGIYKSIFNKEASGERIVLSGRVCSVVLALAAMIAAPLIDTSGSLHNYLQKINATFFGPMLAVILLGFFTRRVPALAAKVVLIGGPVLFFLLVFAFEGPVQAFLRDLFRTPYDIHFLHLLALIFSVSVIFMLVVGLVSPAQKIYKAEYTHDVDITPWRHAKVVGSVIIVLTIGFYALMAQ
ncbi:transporter [Hyphomonas hirschiana VP5]|uniref:Transporter n=1 Tax=Hyphomonas hirschiana VP5 TaxID=1280951 RepID=A0A059FIV2_9PROT|nr:MULTISPECIES: solute:sodium symporter family transporter [Hyphomonas]KCZ90544.1 transporter [Hyphomonas hirschiana VP5]